MAAARLGARLGVEVNANETMSPQRFYEILLLQRCRIRAEPLVVEGCLLVSYCR